MILLRELSSETFLLMMWDIECKRYPRKRHCRHAAKHYYLLLLIFWDWQQPLQDILDALNYVLEKAMMT
jgi:hypothetical protein